MDKTDGQLVLHICVEQKASIPKPAALNEELAEVLKRSYTLEVGESQRHKVLCTGMNLAFRNLIVAAGDEAKSLGWHSPCSVDGVNDQIHDCVLVGGLMPETLSPERGHHATGQAP